MNIQKHLFCFLFAGAVLFASAQNEKNSLPYSSKIEVSDKLLAALVLSTNEVNVDLAPGFHIEGNIESKSAHGPNIISILIKLKNRDGTIFSLTQYHEQNGKTYYSGQILKLHEAEGMLLIAEEQRYYFIETQQRFLVSE